LQSITTGLASSVRKPVQKKKERLLDSWANSIYNGRMHSSAIEDVPIGRRVVLENDSIRFD